jgi:hypothetical protein
MLWNGCSKGISALGGQEERSAALLHYEAQDTPTGEGPIPRFQLAVVSLFQ